MTNGFRAQRHPEDIHPYSLETPLHTRLWHNPHNSFAAMESRVWIHPPRLIDRMDKGKVHGNSFKPNKMNIRNQWCFIQTAPAYRNREESPPPYKICEGKLSAFVKTEIFGHKGRCPSLSSSWNRSQCGQSEEISTTHWYPVQVFIWIWAAEFRGSLWDWYY